MSPPVSCSGDGVPSALRPVDRAQPPMLGQHQRSGVGLHQRCGSGHGGQLPGERPAWSHFTENVRFLLGRVDECRRPLRLFCLSGWSRQVSPLRGSRGGVPSRAAVCVPAVCSHLPGGCDRPRLLDGPLPGGSGTWSHGLSRPQYPLLTSGTSSLLCRYSTESLNLINLYNGCNINITNGSLPFSCVCARTGMTSWHISSIISNNCASVKQVDVYLLMFL